VTILLAVLRSRLFRSLLVTVVTTIAEAALCRHRRT
jgi:hypothetical protein